MAVKTSRPLAARTYQVVTLSDLTGGLDLRVAPSQLGPTRARVLRNYSLEEPGALIVRPGYRSFTTTSLGSSAAQGAQRVYLASTAFTLVAWGGAIYQPSDTGVWGSAVFSGLDSTAMVFFPYDRDLVAVMDSTTAPRKSTNGSSWTLMGIEPSTRASTANSTTAGNLGANEFEFSFTYKDRGLAHESNESTALSTRTLGSTGAVRLEIPNSSDAQVDAIVIYARNKTAGELVRRRATSGAMGSTSGSSTLTVTSSGWTTEDEAPTTHRVPPVLAFGVPWRNRWWGVSASQGNRLHFSEVFQPQSWPALYYIDMPFERGDAIRSLVPLGDTLLVFGDSKPYLIIGETSLDFTVRPTSGSVAGALGPRAVAVIENGVVHGAAEGVFIFDGASDRYLSQDIEPGWRDLMQFGSQSDLRRVAIVHHFLRKELRISVPRLYPRGARGEWILDLNRTRLQNEPAWTDTDRSVGGYLLWDGAEPQTGDRGRLFTWNATTGRLWEEAVGTSADGANLTAEYQSPELAAGLHRANWVDVHGEYEPNNGTFSLQAVVDGVTYSSISIGIGGGLARYGSAIYGTSTYGGTSRRKFYTELPLGAAGRAITLKTSYSGQGRFRHFTLGLGMVPETRPTRLTE